MTGKVREQILKVRDTGRTNMFDTNGVQYVANELGLYDLVVYLMDKQNRKEYSHFIFTGITKNSITWVSGNRQAKARNMDRFT